MKARSTIKWRYMLASVAVGVGIMLLKFYAYWVTGSAAIFSDALESIINVLAAAFGLYAVRLSEQPRDEGHPYGHGKVEFIAAGFEGGLIVMAGGGILYKGSQSLLDPSHTLQALDVGLLFTVIAMLANLGMGLALIRAGKQHHSLTLQADGHHLLSDTWSSVGLVAGLGIIYFTHWYWADGVIAILMGLLVVYQGLRLVRKSLAGLMDESDEASLQKILDVLNKHRKPAWIDIHNLRVVRHGADVHIDCHVTLPWYYTLAQAHDEMHAVEDTLRYHLGTRVEIFIHADPCIPASCTICTLADCNVRQQPFKQRLDWTLANTLPNAKHGL
jgi:cation diffusion facilitator family transporter